MTERPIETMSSLLMSRRTVLKYAVFAGALGITSPLLLACGEDDDAEGDGDGGDTGNGEESTATQASSGGVDASAEPTTAGESSDATEDSDEGSSESSGDAPGKMGGTGRVALYSEPPTLDSTWTTAIVVLVPSQHVFEYLFAWDSQWDSKPFLLESFEVAEDGLAYTFTLRQGLKFHNGDDLVASDVVGSLNRWGQLAGEGKAAYESITDVTAPDDTTIQVTLSEPFSPMIPYLTGPGGGAMIMPAEIAEAAGTERLEEYVGTGPYKFVEHIPDRHLKMERFEDYSPREEPPDAYAGRRTAYFDELLFITVPDAAARIAGVEAGDYDWAEEVTRDEYERLQESSDVDAIVIKPLRFQGVIFNKQKGPMTDQTLRQAVQLALNLEEIMAAAFGPQDFWRLQPSLMPPESVWYTEAGAENYNANDIERAKQLVEESSYSGETIRWMGPSDREDYFAIALAGVQMLRDIGLEAELVSMDWGSLVERRTNPDEYDIFNTGFSFNPEPTTLSFVPDDWPGWWVSEKKDDILNRIMSETDFEERKKIWDEFQLLVYEEVPVIRTGDFFGLSIKRSVIQGENIPISSFPIFWNVWSDE